MTPIIKENLTWWNDQKFKPRFYSFRFEWEEKSIDTKLYDKWSFSPIFPKFFRFQFLVIEFFFPFIFTISVLWTIEFFRVKISRSNIFLTECLSPSKKKKNSTVSCIFTKERKKNIANSKNSKTYNNETFTLKVCTPKRYKSLGWV